jgi:hypothetical protein
MALSSSRRGNRVNPRVDELERRVTALEKHIVRPEWERLQDRARRLGVSVRTIDRDVERGVLEKRRDPGTNRSYVREKVKS